ncbi:Transcriptional regulator [Fusobacterium sp. oral taxon C10]
MNNKLIINYNGETAVHPAYYIKEILDTKEMTLKELSNKINLSPYKIKKIISLEKQFDNEVITKIANVFKTSKNVWKNLLKEYNILERKSKKEENYNTFSFKPIKVLYIGLKIKTKKIYLNENFKILCKNFNLLSDFNYDIDYKFSNN